jgi:sugar phosphate isomerase/epimerase
VSTPVTSIQLYSVNEALTADLDGTLARLAGFGLTTVEAFDFVRRADELAAAFARHGLAAPTGHAPFLSDEIRFGDTVMPVPPFADVLAAAKTAGITTVIDPMSSPEIWLDAEKIDALAARLNAAAAEAAEHGIRVGYHNHAQEFNGTFDGVSGYERFASRLDPGVVLELDTFWAATAGQDVEALIRRLGDRVIALHIKDGTPGVNPFAPDAAPFDPAQLVQKPAGQGDLPVAAYIGAASALEYAVIEFDYYPDDLLEGIGQAVSFLRENGLSA